MKLTGISLLILIMTMNCRLDEEGASETDFVAISQQKYGSITQFAGFLVKKVHETKISIVYGFSGNNHCGRRFTGQYEKQLKDSVTNSIKVWFAPLTNRNNIVNNFEYEHKKTHKDRVGSLVMK